MPECRACTRDLPVTAFDWGGKGKASGQRRKTCRRCRGSNQRRAAPVVEVAKPKRFTRALDGVRRFIITSAQNATPVNVLFFGALQLAAEAMGAELVVIPYRYKNPTGWQSEHEKDAEWWDALVEPYLFNTRKKLCDSLVLAADVRIQATTSAPLSGFESLTGAESCIIGHSKMQFRSVPVPQGRYAKILSTTGSCTERNLSETKAGALAKFHHFLGGLVVEIDGPRFHLRQINADRRDGSFIDLNKRYSVDGVEDAPPALALIMGDTHVRFTDKGVDRATFGDDGMVDVLQPRELVFHDLFDGYSVNPHHAGDPFIAQAKYQARMGDVREEVEEAVRFVVERAQGRRAVIVPSNHDNFLARWIRNTDWRQNPVTAAFYLETAQAMLASVRMGPGGAEYEDPFRYWVERLKGAADVLALQTDESHTIGGIEVGLHGDRGPNGARGTLKNLSRLGARVVTAHEHAPGIEEGNYKVGTSTPRHLEYTHGPSSWLNTHCAIYATGKRALISVVDDRWRAPL